MFLRDSKYRNYKKYIDEFSEKVISQILIIRDERNSRSIE
ncbi:hypothetical protein HMPREF3186_01488 [Gemella haemolysans]|uniref:Uncharacterized protein n=1 Tax=Gemella haemolysans TaxID=1379 RepID=A0A133ZS51_9BACL|nr:hypothetical protein HMPREF3186_01488 [Gemella haemolysans]